MAKRSGKKSAKKQDKPLIENRRVRAAVYRVAFAGALALALLFLSGISLLTLIFGADCVEVRDDMSKGAMQSLTGEVLGTVLSDDSGAWMAVQGGDGVIVVLADREVPAGQEITAVGFVRVLDDDRRAALFSWYDENGDFAGGPEHFDNVSPLYIHDGYGRLFPILPSKIMSACTMLCGIYMVLVYMGIQSGKYGENR